MKIPVKLWLNTSLTMATIKSRDMVGQNKKEVLKMLEIYLVQKFNFGNISGKIAKLFNIE
jgi:hypothetical protein